MPYEPKTWKDGPEGGTPIVAEALNHIEEGILAAEEAAGTTPGPKGEKGDPGAKGDKGDKGDKGEKGDPGKDATLPPAGTAAALAAGTDTTATVWSAKVLHDEIAAEVAAAEEGA